MRCRRVHRTFHFISQEDESFDVFTVDELTDDWIYYNEIECINVYTINGLSYYDVQCAEGYDYDKALEIAKGLLSDNIVQLKSTEIIALKEQLMERYNASTKECEIITWTDLVPES